MLAEVGSSSPGAGVRRHRQVDVLCARLGCNCGGVTWQRRLPADALVLPDPHLLSGGVVAGGRTAAAGEEPHVRAGARLSRHLSGRPSACVGLAVEAVDRRGGRLHPGTRLVLQAAPVVRRYHLTRRRSVSLVPSPVILNSRRRAIGMRREVTEMNRSAQDGAEGGIEELVFSKFPIFRELKQIAVMVPDQDWNELPADLAVNLDDYLYPGPKK